MSDQKLYSLQINWKSIERKNFTFRATRQNRHEWKGCTCACGCGFTFMIRDWLLIDDSMSYWCPLHFCFSPRCLRVPEEWEFKRIDCKSCLYKGTDISECPNTLERTQKWNTEDLSDTKMLLNASTTHGFHGNIKPDGTLNIMFCKSFKEDKEIPLEVQFKEVKCRGDQICAL